MCVCVCRCRFCKFYVFSLEISKQSKSLIARQKKRRASWFVLRIPTASVRTINCRAIVLLSENLTRCQCFPRTTWNLQAWKNASLVLLCLQFRFRQWIVIEIVNQFEKSNACATDPSSGRCFLFSSMKISIHKTRVIEKALGQQIKIYEVFLAPVEVS